MRTLKYTNLLVNIILGLMLCISLVGAVSLLPQIVNGITNNFVLVLDVLIIALIIVCLSYSFFKSFFHTTINHLIIFLKNKKVLAVIFAILFVWQISCVYLLAGTGEWDWKYIAFQAVTGEVPGWPSNWPDYFSLSPNNLLLLKLESIFWHLMGKPSLVHFMYMLDVANVIIVDLATFLIWKLSKYTNPERKKSTFVLILTLLIFTLVPYFVIPYSDTVSFLLCPVLIYSFIALFNANDKKKHIIYGILIGLELTFDYFIKPSLTIIFIAAFITFVLFIISKKDNGQWKMFALSLLFITISFGCSYVALNNYLNNHNGVVKIDKTRSFPLTHFAAMGIKGDGGFNDIDFQNSLNTIDAKQRSKDSISLVKQRYRDLGGKLGYQKFLIHKQIMNSADGTFGWGLEGTYLSVFNKNSSFKNNTFQRKFYLNTQGVAKPDSYNFRFIQQILWIFVLLLSIFGLFQNSLFNFYIKVAIIGFSIFLLIFEGGRSRYLIQFLPLLLLLSSNGWNSLARLKNRINI